MPVPESTNTKAVWSEIRRLSESLVEAHSKIDDLEEHERDHELRLRTSEERRFPMQQIAVIAAVLSLLVAVVAIWAQAH